MKRQFSLLIWQIVSCLIIATTLVQGQISGKITDKDGLPLPYATIYLDATSQGTVSNVDGDYEFELPSKGEFTLVFQYVGYKKESFTIDYKGKPIKKDVQLSPDDNLIGELVISADREDPAYAIIRKAIQKRSYYKKLVTSFEADLYVKGTVKIMDAPEKIFGNDIGNMNGVLDSARQGMVYLSESQSKFYFTQPNKTKEIMISSVKSGENDLFTANQFSMFSFDLYDEFLNFGRSIVSPIADNALAHYQYYLEKTIIDEKGKTINKIKIIPKSKNSPLLNGYIYIIDDLWNIHSADIKLYGNALKNTFIDTILLKQVFVPVAKPDTYRLLSQVIDFKAGLFGFKMGGTFTYIFSKYQINKDLSAIFTNQEQFRVEQDALKNDTAFWNEARPIPLTTEETRDYIKKDSLSRIWNSKTYMDSIDRKENRLKISDLLFGYQWNNTYKNIKYVYPNALSLVRFNAVEGFKINFDSFWEWSDSTFRKVHIRPVLEYGFSDKIIKPRLEVEYKFNNRTLGSAYLKVGRKNLQFDPRQPITERNTTWSALFSKINNIYLYQNNSIEVGYKQEVSNGLYINFMTGIWDRKSVEISTDYSFKHREKSYQANVPRSDLSADAYRKNTYWKTEFNFQFRPAQKYSSYPNVKVRDQSDWPIFEAEYIFGVPMDGISKYFHRLSFNIRDQYVNSHLLGYFSYNIELASSFNNKPTYFGDYFHPLSNEVLMPIDPDPASFNLMPYYSFSTNDYYGLVNFRHHFNGYILDRIPLINKTSLKSVAAFSAMYEPNKGEYYETIIGLENFRIGPIVLFGVDYTWAFDHSGFRDRGVTIRLSSLFK